jgi:hypothetical protein
MLHLALALLGAFTAAPAAVAGAASVPFEIGEGTRQVNVWGRGEEISRAYFDEHLPGLFERTLVVDEFSPAGGAVEWIFTGERGGLTVVLDGDRPVVPALLRLRRLRGTAGRPARAPSRMAHQSRRRTL